MRHTWLLSQTEAFLFISLVLLMAGAATWATVVS